jgi:hypothetical protein
MHSDMASNSPTLVLYKGSTGQAAVITPVEETPGNQGRYATAMPPWFDVVDLEQSQNKLM